MPATSHHTIPPDNLFETPTEFLAWWRTSPEGRAAAKAKAEHLDRERRESQHAIKQARAEYAKEFPPAEAEVVRCEKAYYEIEKKLVEAKNAYRVAKGKADGIYSRRERIEGAHFRKLRTDLEDQRITQFRADVDEAIEALRKEGYNRIEGWVSGGWFSDSRQGAVSNSQAFRRRLTALSELRNETNLNALYLSENLERDIAALWASLPDYREVWDDESLARKLKNSEPPGPLIAVG